MAEKINLTQLLGNRIRARRIQLGYTQEYLAEKIGICNQGLSRIEHGIIAPKMNRLPKIAKALGCAVADLFRFKDDTHRSQLDEIVAHLASMDEKTFAFYAPALIRLISGLSTSKMSVEQEPLPLNAQDMNTE